MAKAAPAARKVQAAQVRNDEVLEAASGLTFEKVTNSITQTQVEVQQTLAELAAQVASQMQVLNTIESSIALKRQEMERLNGIDLKTAELEDLNTQINLRREQWAEEQAKRAKEQNEAAAELAKTRKREADDYAYTQMIAHRTAEDAFKTKMEQQEKKAREDKEALEKDWLTRETELKKRETELAELKKKVEEMPEVVRKAENAAQAVATNSVKKEYETKMQLAAKDAELMTKLASQENAALKAQIADLTAQITGLKAQLEQAQRDVKEISQKALESASGRSAMEAMQKVFLEKDQPAKSGK